MYKFELDVISASSPASAFIEVATFDEVYTQNYVPIRFYEQPSISSIEPEQGPSLLSNDATVVTLRGGGFQELAVCINTPTYGLYYSQYSYTQRGRQVDTVAPRDVRVLPKKGGWGAGPLTVSPCPGGSGIHTCTYLHADYT